MKKFLITNSGLFLTILIGLILLGCFGIHQHLNADFLSLAPGVAHAEPLDQELRTGGPAWIYTVWRITLSLANVFVGVILLFFAFVNIAHIDYDTLQLKKTFPGLITGIIMANFSLVICRMMVDIASILTLTFTQDSTAMVNGILCSLTFTPQTTTSGLVTLGIAVGAISAFGGPLLLLLILILVAVFLGVLFLSLMMLIRKSIIEVLAAVAPLAFIMLAFPPTETYFKKWWEWFLSWTFMGPIMMALLWIAGQVGGHCGDPFSMTRTLAVLALVYLAATVPFSMGGVIMGAIKKTAQGAYKVASNNPWSKASTAKMKQKAGNWFNKTGIGQSWRNAEATTEDYNKLYDTQAKGAQDEARRGRAPREQSEIDMQMKAAQDITADISARVEENLNRMEAGQLLDGLTNDDVQRFTGHATAQAAASQFVRNAARVNQAKKAIAKRRALDIFTMARHNNEANTQVRNAMRARLTETELPTNDPNYHAFVNNQDGVTATVYDSNRQARGRQNFTHADLVDQAADWRLNGKKAAQGSQQQQECFRIAQEYEQQAQAFQDANPQVYDYQAVLDRNLSGRQFAEINTVHVDEAKTEEMNTTGFNVLADTRKRNPGDLRRFGTAEIRGTDEDFDRFLRGEQHLNEGFGNDASLIKRDATMGHARKGVSSGDVAGVYALNDIVNRIQEAREVWRGDPNHIRTVRNVHGQDIQIDEGESKANLFQDSLERLTIPAQRQHMEEQIYNQYRESLPPAAQAHLRDLTGLNPTQRQTEVNSLLPGQRTVALRNFDLTRLSPSDRGDGIIHKSFLRNVYGGVERDENLRFGESSGATAGRSPAAGDAHPLTNPTPRNQQGQNPGQNPGPGTGP